MKRAISHSIPWLLFFIVVFILQFERHTESSLTYYFLIQILLVAEMATIFYLNYFIIVPYTLIKKKRILLFIVSLIGLIIIGYCLSLGVKFFYDWLMKEDVAFDENALKAINSTLTNFIFIVLSTGARLFHEYQQEKINKAELNEIVKKAELDALKAQINPHFLYNAFNTLYGLATIKSEGTADAILQLSDIMRYVTYQSSKNQVSIKEELTFITAYISFQKLRMEDPETKIKCNLKVPEEDFMISPLLLLSFVENAFKHSNLLRTGIQVTIDFKSNGEELTYEVSNLIAENKITNSGIGLKSLKKMLELSYPDKHQLEIKTDAEMHYAKLKLNFKND